MATMGDKAVFLDTNVLVYASVAEAPFHHIARERIQPLKNPETEFWISRQVLREYLATFNPPHRLIIANLEDCLKGSGGPPGVLTVLKPLTLPSQEALTEAADQRIREIDALNLPDEKVKILLELLEYAILQRFPELTLEEIRTMLHLTPLDKTVAGQELIQIGKEEGRKEGQVQGELIGEIRAIQRVLKQTVSPREELVPKNTGELRAILKQLEEQLR